MLNRKLSNYIYYGTLALIAVIVLLVRLLLVGSINNEIDTLKQENTSLDAQITALNDEVQTYYNYQSDYIYDLYKQIPSNYSEDMLEFKIVSKLERLGISEDEDFQRKIFITPDTVINDDSLSEYTDTYGYVEIQVSFLISDTQYIHDFLDSMYTDDQMFILDGVSYAIPEEGVEDVVTVTMSFIAFYADEALNNYN
jgi:hypothetical protein